MASPSSPDRDLIKKKTISSVFIKTVCLVDWWLIKSENDFHGKRLAVGGVTSKSKEQQAIRVFMSSPIFKKHDEFTLETADGITVIVKGLINRDRTLQNGFPSEVCNHFLFGFPYDWEAYSDECFHRESTSAGVPTSSPVYGECNDDVTNGGEISNDGNCNCEAVKDEGPSVPISSNVKNISPSKVNVLVQLETSTNFPAVSSGKLSVSNGKGKHNRKIKDEDGSKGKGETFENPTGEKLDGKIESNKILSGGKTNGSKEIHSQSGTRRSSYGLRNLKKMSNDQPTGHCLENEIDEVTPVSVDSVLVNNSTKDIGHKSKGKSALDLPAVGLKEQQCLSVADQGSAETTNQNEDKDPVCMKVRECGGAESTNQNEDKPDCMKVTECVGAESTNQNEDFRSPFTPGDVKRTNYLKVSVESNIIPSGGKTNGSKGTHCQSGTRRSSYGLRKLKKKLSKDQATGHSHETEIDEVNPVSVDSALENNIIKDIGHKSKGTSTLDQPAVGLKEQQCLSVADQGSAVTTNQNEDEEPDCMKVADCGGTESTNQNEDFWSPITPGDEELSTSRKKAKRKLVSNLHVHSTRHRMEISSIVSPESLSCKRSKSGRLLVPPLAFWDNQLAVYDADGQITGIQNGLPTGKSSAGSKSVAVKRKKNLI